MVSKLVWVGMAVGSTLCGFLPVLWGEDTFSVAGVVCSVLGGLVGIYCGYQLGQRF
jgi:hypothetical protein